MREKNTRKRPTLKIVSESMMVDGERVEIDPTKTNLPDRCKLALAEMITGQQHELVESGS